VTFGRPGVLLLGDTLNVGGTERQFVKVARGLDAMRWDVHVACLRAEGPLRAELDRAALRVWTCGHGSLKPPRSLATIFGLARYVRRHHIRLVHSFDFYSNLVGVPAARLAGVAVIASQRNLGDLRPPFHRFIQRRVLGAATRVIVNSGAIVARLHGAIRQRIDVIPNGVDTGRFGSPSRGRRPVMVFGALANLHPYKGLGDLIRATAVVRQRHPRVRVLIWGEGRARPDLERAIDELDLRGHVELRGLTSDVPGALGECDAFVLPSLSEGCSNALLEAMASGLPVIASDVGGNGEIVQGDVGGLLVPAGDSAAVARAMARLIEDPALADRLAARGAERVRSDFSVERMLERMETAYRGALASVA